MVFSDSETCTSATATLSSASASGDDRWPYLVLLIEFQSDVDHSMAVRMVTCTELFHQRLIDEGVLREHGALPPVLIAIYSGLGPWTAPADMADLLPATEGALAPYSPSQRYFLLDDDA